MSRGLGWVQQACLRVIRKYEDGKRWPTTFNIAADIYQLKPDADGNRWVNAAQHVAVKRALESLQRQGRVIGFRADQARNPAAGDGRTELAHSWMTETGLLRWLRQRADAAGDAARAGGDGVLIMKRAIALAERAKSLGMTVPETWARP